MLIHTGALTKTELPESPKMANCKCIPATVEESKHAISAPMADAYAFLEVARLDQECNPMLTLATGILERLTAAIDTFDHMLHQHGMPAYSPDAAFVQWQDEQREDHPQ